MPTGHRIELYTEMALSKHGPMTLNPELWQEEPHGMRVTRFDHCNLHGRTWMITVMFFTELLGFSLTDIIESFEPPPSAGKSAEVARTTGPPA